MVASLVTVMLGLVVMIVIKQFDKGEKRQINCPLCQGHFELV